MREKGERVRVLSQGRKGGGRILIQTESVYRKVLTKKSQIRRLNDTRFETLSQSKMPSINCWTRSRTVIFHVDFQFTRCPKGLNILNGSNTNVEFSDVERISPTNELPVLKARSHSLFSCHKYLVDF